MKGKILLIFAAALLCACCVAAAGETACAAKLDDAAAFQTCAKSAVVVEKCSERVLYEKNARQKLPMASTTKIVTALTVIRNVDDLEKSVEIPPQAVGVEGSSVYLRQGEHLTIRELLYGLMLRSGNDCAVALACSVGGSVEQFAKMMNDTAVSLGCADSNFTNPHGLPDDDHYTTAYDLAKITCAALSDPNFSQIVRTKKVTVANEFGQVPRVLANKNKLLFNFDGADGVKTGYTKKAGRCFVGSATRNNMQVVVVVLDCGPMFEDTAKLLSAAFANFKLQCVIPENKLCGVVYTKGKPVYYVCEKAFYFPAAAGEKLTRRVVLENTQQVEVRLDGNLIATLPLVADC